MQSVAQGWLVYRLSESERVLGLVAAVAYLPILLFAPVAGVVADRFPKRQLILVTQTAAMLLAFTLGTLTTIGWVTVPIVAVIACLLGIVGAFDLPIRQSFLVEMVGPDDLPSAIALNASVFNTARVVGPALAGTLAGTIGEGPCFLLNGVSYLFVIWALLNIHPHRTPVAARAERDLRSGLRYVRGQPVQAALLVALGLVSGLSLQANILMPSLSQRVFGRGATGYGLLLTCYGVGAVLSALRLASRRWSSMQHRRNLVAGLGVFGVGLLGVAASPRFEVALACQVLAGLGMIRFTATTNTLIQLLVDDRFRGRVMGLHTVMFMGTAPLGSLILGSIAQPLGPRAALVLSGSVPLVVGVLLALRLRRSRLFSPVAGPAT